jgi:PAP2 superfamily protein
MLATVVGLFLTTEAVARAGLVSHLQPLSLRIVATNILFAIGFGSPVVLYVSSLPPWREALVALALGGAITLALAAGLGELGVAQMVIGLGLGSLLTLSWRAVRARNDERIVALLYLLPSIMALIFTLQAGVFLGALPQAIPFTFDSLAYVADSGFGFQPSFALGRVFAALPALAWICFVIYAAPPPILTFVYSLQLRAGRPPPIDAITVLLVLGLAGYAFYFLYPVCGPLFAFGAAFPDAPPDLEPFMGRQMFVPPAHASHPAWRNAMPSLHFGSVLLALWHAWPYGRWARIISLVFLFGTVLATLGLGEHYLIDLVVAMPFTLAVHAACMPHRESYARPRALALVSSGGLVAVWYVILFRGTSLLAAAPVLTWSLSLATLGAVIVLERRLSRAALPTNRRPIQ